MNMGMRNEILRVRASLINQVCAEFDRLIAMLDTADAPVILDRTIPITADPILFKRQRPLAVLFGTEQVITPTWKAAYGAILTRCNQDPQCHDRLMELRDKAGGYSRIFLTSSPAGMKNPYKVDEDLYAETSYGIITLMQILTNRILAPLRYDYSEISVIVKESNMTAKIGNDGGTDV